MAKKPGRPTKMTEATVKKLDDAFVKGLSDAEACIYAGISKQALYDYCHAHPEYTDRKELLKQNVKMRAKVNVAERIEFGDIDASKWYLERKDPEFSNKQKIEHSGEINNPFAALSEKELKQLVELDDG